MAVDTKMRPRTRNATTAARVELRGEAMEKFKQAFFKRGNEEAGRELFESLKLFQPLCSAMTADRHLYPPACVLPSGTRHYEGGPWGRPGAPLRLGEHAPNLLLEQSEADRPERGVPGAGVVLFAGEALHPPGLGVGHREVVAELGADLPVPINALLLLLLLRIVALRVHV